MGKLFICPQPSIWHEVHQKLLIAKNGSTNPNIPNPPIPLILAAWWHTTKEEKRERWNNTIDWANNYGFSNLLPVFKTEEMFFD